MSRATCKMHTERDSTSGMHCAHVTEPMSLSPCLLHTVCTVFFRKGPDPDARDSRHFRYPSTIQIMLRRTGSQSTPTSIGASDARTGRDISWQLTSLLGS